jgi:ParB-like chromosome segregation protein Spo0J
LTLCDEVKNLLIHKELTESQARFLIGLDENKQIKLSQRIIKEELTVKEISKLIQEINGKTKVIKKDLKLKTTHSLPSDYVKNALWLCKNIQGSVLKCQGDNAKGKIIISWG